MEENIEKPSAEAKALSLFLMAYKSKDRKYKEKARRINKQWDRVKTGEVSREDYLTEVETMLESFGGYSKVIEQTVWFYITKTGEWKLQGDDKYCQDAQLIADEALKKK